MIRINIELSPQKKQGYEEDSKSCDRCQHFLANDSKCDLGKFSVNPNGTCFYHKSK